MTELEIDHLGATLEYDPDGNVLYAPVVSETTRAHERKALVSDNYRVSWQTWRSVSRQRIKNLAFLRSTDWLAVY